MLLNFLDASLSPTVQCSATAEDNYSEQNLIADSDSSAFLSGFMAYSVVKPPVDLLFTLCCPIELQSIILKTRSGSLKSNGFEVFTKVSNSTKDEFRKVGQVYNLKQDGVLFYNTYTSKKYSSHIQSGGDGMLCSELFLNLGRRALVTQVKITIKCTERCVPVMKEVKIYGLPGKSLPQDTRMAIMAKWERRITVPKAIDLSSDNTTDNTSFPLNSNTILNATIPEEFLDCITFEMMSLPMVLPSGKVVDKSTLDRHSKSEEAWGRSPSDPFTGVSFTEHSKPILNAALKSQIDKFLLANQHRSFAKTIPRTVGAAAKRANHDMLLYSTESSNLSSKRQRTETSPAIAIGMVGGSLDDSVRLALSSMTRFTTTLRHTNSFAAAEFDKCRTCDSDQVLYRITQCTHLVCRTCLLDAGKAEKCACGQDFIKSDVVRYYKKDII